MDYGATPPAASTLESMTRTIGLTVMLVSVSAAMHLGAGGFGLLVSFGGVLVGVSIIALGVRMASCAFTAVFGEEDPVLCFAMFALLLLGLTLVNITLKP